MAPKDRAPVAVRDIDAAVVLGARPAAERCGRNLAKVVLALDFVVDLEARNPRVGRVVLRDGRDDRARRVDEERVQVVDVLPRAEAHGRVAGGHEHQRRVRREEPRGRRGRRRAENGADAVRREDVERCVEEREVERAARAGLHDVPRELGDAARGDAGGLHRGRVALPLRRVVPTFRVVINSEGQRRRERRGCGASGGRERRGGAESSPRPEARRGLGHRRCAPELPHKRL